MKYEFEAVIEALVKKNANKLKVILQQMSKRWSENEIEMIMDSDMEEDVSYLTVVLSKTESRIEGYFLCKIMCQCIKKEDLSYFRDMLFKKGKTLYSENINTVDTTGEKTDLWYYMCESWRCLVISCALESNDDRFFQMLYKQNIIWEDEIMETTIIKQNVSAVKWILDQGFNPNTYVDGNTAMWILKQGYNHHEKSTPLNTATKMKNVDIVKLLIQYNADVNMGTYTLYKYPPLSVAITEKYVEICSILLQNGATINSRNNGQERSHLHNCATNPSQRITELVLEAGCCINVTDRSGHSPLYANLYSNQRKEDWDDFPNMLIQHGSYVNRVFTKDCLSISLSDKYVLTSWNEECRLGFYRNALKAGLVIAKDDWKKMALKESKLEDLRREHTESQNKLRFLCRLTVRNHLVKVGKGTSIYPRVQKLPLPVLLKSYLMLEL